MPTTIALLRAINVGRRRVKMDALRDAFTDLGLTQVATVLASGNVVFDHEGDDLAALEARLTHHLGSTLGFEVPTMLRSGPATVALDEAVQDVPGATTYVAFLACAPDDGAQRRLDAAATPTDTFEVRGTEVLWRCTTRISDSPFSGASFEKLVGVPATVRKIDTLRKLAALTRAR